MNASYKLLEDFRMNQIFLKEISRGNWQRYIGTCGPATVFVSIGEEDGVTWGLARLRIRCI
jgi:hypothetical protein